MKKDIFLVPKDAHNIRVHMLQCWQPNFTPCMGDQVIDQCGSWVRKYFKYLFRPINLLAEKLFVLAVIMYLFWRFWQPPAVPCASKMVICASERAIAGTSIADIFVLSTLASLLSPLLHALVLENSISTNQWKSLVCPEVSWDLCLFHIDVIQLPCPKYHPD